MRRMIGEAFRLNVKNSLLELSRAINGDGKSTPNPLFKLQVILESYEESMPSQYSSASGTYETVMVTKYRVNFSPTLDQIAHLINSIATSPTPSRASPSRRATSSPSTRRPSI